MKKKILALAVIAVSLSIAAHNTLAYFTAEDKAHNVITTDGVDITIVEWQQTDEGLVPYPKDEPIRVMPGITVSKIVTVKNNEAESYIRAKFDVVVIDAMGKTMELDAATLDSIITVAPNEAYWLSKEIDDEWYYYKDAVDVGIVTEPLFSEVVFSGVNMTNEYQNCKVEINVVAQAVQTANNGSTVMEAAGWPNN